MDGSHIVNEILSESAPPGRRPGLRRGLVEAAYVLCVTAVAAWGFYSDSTAQILLAVLLALPMGAPALVGYYMAYGLLSQVGNANPDVARSGGRCTPYGGCESFTTGEPAEWFLNTMDVIGVLALATAAVLNVILLRILTARRRNRTRSLANLGS